MTAIVAGTRQAHATHSRTWGPLGLLLSMAPPVALIVAGIVVDGWGAISWLGAIVWGVVAAVAFALVAMMGRTVGMTRMDLLDLLGSLVAAPRTAASQGLGAVVHLANGAVLAIAWAYGTALGGLSANVWTGLAWGAVLWVLALLMLSTIGSVHPAIRAGRQDDPGLAATNFGPMTPAGILVSHLVWGAVLGLGYAAWPLG
jgi:hypothetical protein